MKLLTENKVFGSPLRTKVLLAIALLEETFPAELARLLACGVYSVQRVTAALENEGLLASRKLGLERRFTLNPRYFANEELKTLLLRMAEADSDLMSALSKRRGRPRRQGKEI